VTCQEQNADTWCSTLHIVISHKIVMSLLTAERNSNLSMFVFFIIYSKKSVKPHSIVLKTVLRIQSLTR